jgi:hypothetical protein
LGTNFNVVLLENDNFEVPCWRYSKAEEMLDKMQNKGTFSVDGVFKILDKVHQEGRKNNTLYSNVFDLKNGVVYLTYWYQFDEVITLNVAEEIDKHTSIGAVPNSSDKVRLRSLFSEKTVSHAEKSFQRYVNALSNLERIAYIWVIQMMICAIFTLIDLLRQPDIHWTVKCIWVLVSFFLGVMGLLVYWVSFKRPLTMNLQITKFISALGSAALSAVGFTFVFFLLSLVVFFAAQNANLGIFALIVPFVIGLLFYRVPMMVFFTEEDYWKSVLKYLLPELLSTVLAVICIILINQYIGDYFNQYSRYIGTPADIFFWIQFSLYTLSGLSVLYLLHLILMHFNVNLWPTSFGVAQAVID